MSERSHRDIIKYIQLITVQPPNIGLSARYRRYNAPEQTFWWIFLITNSNDGGINGPFYSLSDDFYIPGGDKYTRLRDALKK